MVHIQESMDDNVISMEADGDLENTAKDLGIPTDIESTENCDTIPIIMDNVQQDRKLETGTTLENLDTELDSSDPDIPDLDTSLTESEAEAGKLAGVVYQHFLGSFQIQVPFIVMYILFLMTVSEIPLLPIIPLLFAIISSEATRVARRREWLLYNLAKEQEEKAVVEESRKVVESTTPIVVDRDVDYQKVEKTVFVESGEDESQKSEEEATHVVHYVEILTAEREMSVEFEDVESLKAEETMQVEEGGNIESQIEDEEVVSVKSSDAAESFKAREARRPRGA